MVIVEGMDNSGKTTLANVMGKTMGIPVIPSVGDKDLEYRHNIHLIHCRAKHPYIIDRTPSISELVYGPALRGQCRLPFPYEKLRQLLEASPIIVYCRPSRDRVIQFKEDIPQLDGVVENASKLLERYDRLMEAISNEVQILQYDYDHCPAQEILSKVAVQLDRCIRSRARDGLWNTVQELIG